MTDYNTWFKSPIRKGVLNPDDTTTPEFDNWTKSCTGKVRVTKVFIEGIVYPYYVVAQHLMLLRFMLHIYLCNQ